MSSKYIPDSIDVKIKATHFEFVNKNAVFYTGKAVDNGASSWTAPFNKPQLVAHNKQSDPIGRIVDYEVLRDATTSSSEPPNFVRLIARITDPDSIAKVMDGRYNTVSVGSRTSRVVCSECGQVITEEGLCEHKKGSYDEDGNPVYWIIDEIEYVENSFVNEPADQFAGIEEINVGAGWVTYTDFLDNTESFNKNKSLEDSMTKKEEKLSVEQRNKLSESVFCGPGRSFPAHDKVHTAAGLKLIEKSEFSDNLKSKIKSALYRKGKRYGITPSEDELEANPNVLTDGMELDFNDEQIKEVEDFFKLNPDADLPSDDTEEQTDETTVVLDTVDIKKLKREELKDFAIELQTKVSELENSKKESIETRDEKITNLETKLQDADTILLQREDEIAKYLDENALLEKKFRDAVISNIIDLKVTDNTSEEREALTIKYEKRQLGSLIDALQDLRNEKHVSIETSEEKVEDTTLPTENNSDDTINNKDQNEEKSSDKFSLFDRDRSQLLEVE